MTTAQPANLPVGTMITSPGLSSFSDAAASSRRSAWRALLAPFSASLIALAQAGVLHEVAAVAGGGLAVALEGVLGLAQLAGQPDDGLVGLELGERLLQQLRASAPGRTGAPG